MEQILPPDLISIIKYVDVVCVWLKYYFKALVLSGRIKMGDMMQFFGRLVLVVINLVLLLTSLAMTIAGFIIKFGASVFSKYTDSVLDSVKQSAKVAFDDDISTEQFDFEKLFGFFGVLLIVIGVFLLTVSIFGCCGACCKIKMLLMLYAIVLGILVIGQITFVVMFFKYNSVLKGAIRKPLEETLKNYHGLNGTEADSLVWNFLMQQFECCGIEGYEDFSDTKWFGGEFGNTENLTMPLACCNDLPEDDDFSCAETIDSDLNNYNKGCLDALWDELLGQNQLYSYIVSIGVILFQVILLVFALMLYCKKDEKKVHPDIHKGYRSKGGRQHQDTW
ncbi:hypothetical protein ACF0H5_011512 [Mactra antiquata]